jgi:plastocyanin
MKRRFLLMGLAGVVGALIATLPILTATAAPLPMTDSFITSDFAFTASEGGTTVKIAVGGTVDFSYPSGGTMHNVDFGDGPQPTSCTLDGSDQAPPIPTVPTAPGWSGSCTFNTAGTYTFHCDKHAFMAAHAARSRSPRPRAGSRYGAPSRSQHPAEAGMYSSPCLHRARHSSTARHTASKSSRSLARGCTAYVPEQPSSRLPSGAPGGAR